MRPQQCCNATPSQRSKRRASPSRKNKGNRRPFAVEPQPEPTAQTPSRGIRAQEDSGFPLQTFRSAKAPLCSGAATRTHSANAVPRDSGAGGFRVPFANIPQREGAPLQWSRNPNPQRKRRPEGFGRRRIPGSLCKHSAARRRPFAVEPQPEPTAQTPSRGIRAQEDSGFPLQTFRSAKAPLCRSSAGAGKGAPSCARTFAKGTRNPPTGSTKPLRLSTCHHPAGRR